MQNLFWLTLVLLIVAALLRSEISFYLLYVVVGLQFAARFWVRRSARSVAWRRQAPIAAFPREPVTIQIELHNQGRLPLPWLALHEHISPALRSPPWLRQVLSLGAGERRHISYTVYGQRRGYYQLGPLTLRTGDVLGLDEHPLNGATTDALTIYPQVLSLGDLNLPASLPFGVLPAARSLFADPARPIGVRNYQPGDSFRQIDWKNSARLGSLQVRRYQPAIALETLIVLALGRNEYPSRFVYDAMERAIVTAASIAAHLVAHRQPVGFCTTGNDPLTQTQATPLPVATGQTRLIEVLRLLGRVGVANHGDLPTLADQTSAHLGWGSTVVLITGSCDATLIAALLPLKRRGLNLALVVIEAFPANLALARQYGISAFRVSREGRPET
ncbi:MAG: DUF58 domain-containing protein [Chloroflexales bacterium]|nr:DUF58 domain-containing protein [Chloroflexales bacterium]